MNPAPFVICIFATAVAAGGFCYSIGKERGRTEMLDEAQASATEAAQMILDQSLATHTEQLRKAYLDGLADCRVKQ